MGRGRFVDGFNGDFVRNEEFYWIWEIFYRFGV